MNATRNSTNPRSLLLALLQAFACDVPVQTLIRAASLFDIDENRTRVALHRLRSKGLVVSEERGTYHIAGAETYATQTTSWQSILDRLRPWDGTWIGVHTAHLPRADKTIARRRDQATKLIGLRELCPTLLIRPENLTGGVSEIRSRLYGLGLEENAPVFSLNDLGPQEDRARHLWDELALDERYRQHIDRLTRLTLSVRTLAPDEAARQAFVVGGEAVRDILLDPLLPAPLVDPAIREAFVETMVAFDHVGRELWSNVLDTKLPLQMAPTIEPR